jgi:hypothetical protein
MLIISTSPGFHLFKIRKLIPRTLEVFSSCNYVATKIFLVVSRVATIFFSICKCLTTEFSSVANGIATKSF